MFVARDEPDCFAVGINLNGLVPATANTSACGNGDPFRGVKLPLRFNVDPHRPQRQRPLHSPRADFVSAVNG